MLDGQAADICASGYRIDNSAAEEEKRCVGILSHGGRAGHFGNRCYKISRTGMALLSYASNAMSGSLG